MAGKRIDANQPSTVTLFRRLGCHVTPTHMVGKGFPDIVVSTRGVTALVEIKNPAQPPSKRQLTKDEKQFHDDCDGYVAIVSTPEHVIGLVHEMRKRGCQ